MAMTPRLRLPLIAAGQAQKEVAHNEALQLLDTLCAPAVEQGPLDTPPVSPVVGASYIVGPAPSGLWAGKANRIANYSAGGWRFIEPPLGTRLVVASTGVMAEFRSGGWQLGVVHADTIRIGGVQVLSAQSGAIAAPAAGTTVDAESRAVIGQILAALRTHGLIAP